MTKASGLDFARLRELLRYDPKTGIFTARIQRGRLTVGTIVGCIRPDGYRQICIDGKFYRASRLAYFYVNGEMPDGTIELDHINTDRADNRWRNLRLATSRQNSWNMSVRQKKNTSYKGVSFHKHTKQYRAYIVVNGQHIHLGLFDTPKNAYESYAIAATKYFGKFARTK